MADLSITGEVVVTSEKAEGAFDRVGAKAGQMASKVQAEATKAGAAVDGIGTGAEKGAEKFTRAESRMREAIMKSTRELEMLGKTASQKFEAQLDFKGLDKAKFQPVLDDLRKMEEATKKAETGFTGMGTAAQMAGRALAAIGIGASVREFVAMADASTNMASKLALVTGSTAELAQVQRRLFDVAQASRVGFVGLADTYTQFARSTKDLGVSQTALLDITKTISQAITISGGSAASAQAALVQLGQGFASGALRGEELNSVLEQTPRLAQAIADGLGVGIGKLREMGSNGELTAEKVLGALQKAAAGIESEFARMTPTIEQSLTKITNSMTRLVGEIDKGVGATAKLSSALGLVSGGIDFLAGDISKLNSQGALRAAADEVLRLDGMAKRLRNTMDSGIVGPNAQANLDALLAKLADAKARFRELDAQLGGAGKDPRDQSGYTSRSQSYANEAKRLEGVQAAMGKVLGNLSGVKDSFFKDLNALYAGYQNGLIKTAEYQQAVANLIRDSGSNKPSAGGKGGDQFAADRDAAQEWARYMKDFSKAAQDASAEADNLTKSQEKLLEFLLSPAYQNASEPMRQLALQSAYAAINQEQANVATKEAAKAAAESSKALGAWYEVREKESQGLQNQINARREEVSMMGMTTEAVVAYTQAKYEQQAAEKEAYAAALESASFYAGEYADAYKTAAEAARQQAKQLRELGGLEVEKANRDAAKKAADEWQRAADDINRSLTDALLRGFESGKGFAENLRDTLKNMFSTLVLRPIISAALSPVAGAVSGLVGNAVGGAAAGSGIGSSIATSIGTSAIGSAFSLGLTNFGTGLGSTLANGVFGGIGTNISNFGTLAGAGNLSGALGVAAPYLAGIGALYAIIKGLDDSGTYHTGGAAQYNAATGLTSGQSGADYGIGFGRVEAGASTISAVGSVAQGLGSALDAMALAFGRKAGYEVATAFADDTSKDGAWGALRISKDGKELLNWDDNRMSKWAPKEFGDGEAGYKEYLAAVAKDTRQVLLDMDLPSWADKMLTSIGDSASMEDLQAVITQIGVVQAAFVGMSRNLVGFADYSEEARGALMELSGGIEALASNASTYYSNFYSADEQRANLEKQLNEEFAKLNLTLPDIDATDARAQYRALIEAQDSSTEEGRKAIAMLLQLAGVFAQVTQTAEDAQAAMEAQAREAQSQAMRNLQEAYSRERKRLEAQLDSIADTRAAYQQQQSIVQETYDTLAGVFDLLHESVIDLYGSVESTVLMQAEDAARFIEQSVSNAQLTGYLPEQDKLSEAISAARAGIDAGVYANSTEQDFAKLVLAGQLKALEAVAEPQKTAAEQQLELLKDQIDALDAQTEAINKQIKLQQESLDYWQEQIDIANGVYDATLSVEEAVKALAKSLGFDGGKKPGGATFGGSGGAAQPPAKYSRVISLGTAGVGYDPIRDQSLIDHLDQLSPIYHSFDGTGDLVGLANAIKAAGGSIADLSILSGLFESDWIAALAKVGIPAFAVGTNYVPRDMVAQIHEGEAIVPKAFNPWANGGAAAGSDNTALIAEIRSLREEVAGLRAAAEETAGATGATADVLVRVTQNGNGMVTAAAPI